MKVKDEDKSCTLSVSISEYVTGGQLTIIVESFGSECLPQSNDVRVLHPPPGFNRSERSFIDKFEAYDAPCQLLKVEGTCVTPHPLFFAWRKRCRQPCWLLYTHDTGVHTLYPCRPVADLKAAGCGTHQLLRADPLAFAARCMWLHVAR